MRQSVLLILAFCTCALSQAQVRPGETFLPSRYTMQLARILTRNGVMKTGWFLGTQGDTLLVDIGRKSERISKTDLLQVEIETNPQKGKAALAGMLMGIYAGNAMVFKADNQPFLFLRQNEQGEVALYSALFGILGGTIGYLAGAATDHNIKFDFSGDVVSAEKAWQELVKGESTIAKHGVVHFAMLGAWVTGPLPSPGAQQSSMYYYGYSGGSRLNMVRKLQLTYSLTDFLDVGFACLWLGQPSVSTFSSTSNGYTNVSLEGTGQYAVGVIQPLWKLGWQAAQWDIGGGLGIAHYDFNATTTYFYSYDGTQQPPTTVEKTQSTFSTLLFSEFKLFLTDYFSLGVIADWVYIPDKVPSVQDFTFDSDHFGTTSVGFVASFHF